MTFLQLLYRVFHTKTSFLAVLTILWAAVGFVGGLLLAKIIWIYQLL